MCGICGISAFDVSDQERSRIVQSMCNLMEHRGPDDSGNVNLKNTCLGMRRLSIIDLTEAGRQPMCNENGRIWIVFNGEIYNYVELRSYLKSKGHSFRSETDTEVVLHLYEDYGVECLEKLRGMFAFAIYDETKNELVIARDRLGIKPLYYSMTANGFIFASEIKCIAKSGLIEAEPDLEAMDLYLSFGYTPPPWTMLRGIRALLPAHYIRLRGNDFAISKWWSFPEPGTTQCSRNEIVPQTRCLLEESIELHRISDVPIGAFLSGGIDSTAVVGLMTKILNRSIKTFSVGFETAVPARFNELSSAQLAAQRFEAEHTEIVVTGDDLLRELDQIIWYLDQPSFDGINTYFVSQAAKRGGLTVSLSGLGGDELFGGYGSYKIIPRFNSYIRMWGHLPNSLRNYILKATKLAINGIVRTDRTQKINRLSWVDSPIGLYALARLTLWPSEKKQLYNSYFRRQIQSATINVGPLSLLEKYVSNQCQIWRMITELELQTYMNWRLLRDTDVMSMAHSLEVRVPLIDHKLVEFVCGLPEGWEKEYGYPKRLLTSAVFDLIPEKIRNAPKHGFEFPLECWMKRNLKEIVEDTLSESSVKKRGLFSTDGITALYRGFLNGNCSYPVIWQLVVLELWLRRIIDKN